MMEHIDMVEVASVSGSSWICAKKSNSIRHESCAAFAPRLKSKEGVRTLLYVMVTESKIRDI
jgi:hypothetical protein